MLCELVLSHPVYKRLKHKPSINLEKVNDNLIEQLPINKRTFTFIDPYGYQGISLGLLNAVINKWGNDCVFYFTTSGIKRNVYKDDQRDSLISIFGAEGFEKTREVVKSSKRPAEKDLYILDVLRNQLKMKYNLYFLPFGIEFEKRRASNYYLVFLSKDRRGFALMKDIMAKESLKTDGIPLFLYRGVKSNIKAQTELYLGDQLEKLKNMLKKDFNGKSIRVGVLIDQCHELRYIYIEKNIKRALLELEIKELIKVDVSYKKRPKRNGRVTLSDKRKVTFK